MMMTEHLCARDFHLTAKIQTGPFPRSVYLQDIPSAFTWGFPDLLVTAPSSCAPSEFVQVNSQPDSRFLTHSLDDGSAPVHILSLLQLQQWDSVWYVVRSWCILSEWLNGYQTGLLGRVSRPPPSHGQLDLLSSRGQCVDMFCALQLAALPESWAEPSNAWGRTHNSN